MINYHPLNNLAQEDEKSASPERTDPRRSYAHVFLAVVLIGGLSIFGLLVIFVPNPGASHRGQPAPSNKSSLADTLPFIGKYTRAWKKGPLLTHVIIKAPAGLASKAFTRNESFRLEPSAASDEAWRSILPSAYAAYATSLSGRLNTNASIDGLGFVQHPFLGPEIVNLAFVHQLHCLVCTSRLFYQQLNICCRS